MHYNNSGERNDTVFNYYSNNRLKDFYAYQNGVLQGNFVEYYENGALKSELVYKNDSLQGLQKTYYANGSPKETIEFKNGKRHGKNIEFDNAGNKVSEF